MKRTSHAIMLPATPFLALAALAYSAPVAATAAPPVTGAVEPTDL